MREIKFRAWIKDYALMADVNFLNIDYKEIVVMINENDYEFNCGEYELMQYTGLKDSFKNDIYEGDILRVTFSWTGDERYGVIEWDNENNASYVFCEKGTNAMAISQIFDEDGDYIKEVIGNIYEHPHLI